MRRKIHSIPDKEGGEHQQFGEEDVRKFRDR